MSNAAKPNLSPLFKKILAQQSQGQHDGEDDFTDAMEAWDLDAAQLAAERDPCARRSLSRQAAVAERRRDPKAALVLLEASLEHVETARQESAYLANRASCELSLGRPRAALASGMAAVRRSPEQVIGAVNAACAASLLRERQSLQDVLALVADTAPGVLKHPRWQERWSNDPQLAWARAALGPMPSTTASSAGPGLMALVLLVALALGLSSPAAWASGQDWTRGDHVSEQPAPAPLVETEPLGFDS